MTNSEETYHAKTKDSEETNFPKVLNDVNDNNAEHKFSYKIKSL